MQPEHYLAALKLVSGISLFVILLLTLRLISLRRFGLQRTLEIPLEWTGLEPLVVTEIIEETPDIKSFRFKRLEGKPFPEFWPGQFITFQIGAEDKLTRSYSVSSSPDHRLAVQVSVKRLKDGVGSQWFHQLKIDEQVWAYPPAGHFVDPETGPLPRVYIAGGVGITPILSMIKTHLHASVAFPLTLFYGARTQADLAFHRELEILAHRHPQFRYFPILSQDANWPGDRGLLTIEFVQKKLTSLSPALYFVCGPEAMSDPLIEKLQAHGVDESLIITEKFVSPSQLNPTLIPERSVQVVWQGRELHYQGRQSLLEFLEGQGESLPFACRTGVCGSCRCQIEGPVRQLSDSGLSAKERKLGLALACVAYPEGDVKVSVVR